MDAKFVERLKKTLVRQLVVETPLDNKNFSFIVERVRHLVKSTTDDAFTVTVEDENLVFSWSEETFIGLTDEDTARDGMVTLEPKNPQKQGF